MFWQPVIAYVGGIMGVPLACASCTVQCDGAIWGRSGTVYRLGTYHVTRLGTYHVTLVA